MKLCKMAMLEVVESTDGGKKLEDRFLLRDSSTVQRRKRKGVRNGREETEASTKLRNLSQLKNLICPINSMLAAGHHHSLMVLPRGSHSFISTPQWWGNPGMLLLSKSHSQSLIQWLYGATRRQGKPWINAGTDPDAATMWLPSINSAHD